VGAPLMSSENGRDYEAQSSNIDDVLAAVDMPEQSPSATLASVGTQYISSAAGLIFEDFIQFSQDYDLAPGFVSVPKLQQLFALANQNVSGDPNVLAPEDFAVCVQMCLAIVMEVLDDSDEVPQGVATLAALALNEEASGSPATAEPGPSPSPELFPRQQTAASSPVGYRPTSLSKASRSPSRSSQPDNLRVSHLSSGPGTKSAPQGVDVSNELAWLKGRLLPGAGPSSGLAPGPIVQPTVSNPVPAKRVVVKQQVPVRQATQAPPRQSGLPNSARSTAARYKQVRK